MVKGFRLRHRFHLLCPPETGGAGESDMKEADLIRCVKALCPKTRVRSRNISKRGYEWILEVAVKNGDDLVTQVAAVPGVVSVNLMSHDGEVRF